MVNKNGIIIHKAANKKGRRHDIYKKNYPLDPNQVIY